jgi:hypothetical protein
MPTLLKKRIDSLPLRSAAFLEPMECLANDVFGLTSAEKKSVDARKQRLARKLDAAV